MDSGLGEIVRASECEQILVISTSGLKAAEYLQETFGVPFLVGYPILPENVTAAAKALSDKRVLIIHAQFAANTLRNIITNCEADCATWFMQDKRYAAAGDFRIMGEDDLREAAARYDVIVGDRMLRRAVRGFSGEWIDFPHYAVSGSAVW